MISNNKLLFLANGLLFLVAITNGYPCQGAPNEERPLVFGSTKSALSQHTNEREAVSALTSLIEHEMPAALGFPMKMRFFDSNREMYQKVASKQVDMGCGHLVEFLEQYKHKRVKPIIWFYQEGKNGDRYCFVLRKGSPYKSPEQLRGLVFGYNDYQDLAKVKYIFYPHNPNFKAETYFAKTIYYPTSKDALASLVKSRRTEVIFNSLYSVMVATRQKNLEGKFDFIINDEVMADLPIFIRANLEADKAIKAEEVKKYFMNMHKAPKTLVILNLLGCDEAREVGEEQEKRYQEWINKYTAYGLIK
ncbi:MAG: PhnD/SsuA/transferrin family substrate-binding protein [candidate division FCPU426 bacterium]